jgi:hypothetical protein
VTSLRWLQKDDVVIALCPVLPAYVTVQGHTLYIASTRISDEVYSAEVALSVVCRGKLFWDVGVVCWRLLEMTAPLRCSW